MIKLRNAVSNSFKNYMINTNRRPYKAVKLTTGIVAYHYKNGSIDVRNERE